MKEAQFPSEFECESKMHRARTCHPSMKFFPAVQWCAEVAAYCSRERASILQVSDSQKSQGLLDKFQRNCIRRWGRACRCCRGTPAARQSSRSQGVDSWDRSL